MYIYIYIGLHTHTPTQPTHPHTHTCRPVSGDMTREVRPVGVRGRPLPCEAVTEGVPAPDNRSCGNNLGLDNRPCVGKSLDKCSCPLPPCELPLKASAPSRKEICAGAFSAPPPSPPPPALPPLEVTRGEPTAAEYHWAKSAK